MATRQLSKVVEHLRSVLVKQDAAGLADGDLLKRYVQQRDEAAFEALVRRHGPMVMGVCRRVLHNAHDAEDAFQATFLVLVRRASTLRSPGMVGNWLYGVAYRTALHARGAAVKRRAKEAEMVTGTQAAEDTWADLRLALDQELERLPDKSRAVLVLCDLEGKTRKEAARHLGWPEGTVASRLASARVMLAKRLARQGFGVSGGVLAAMLSHNASACVPTTVMISTIKAASLFAAGQAAATGVISVKVVALTEGVLKAMLFNKLKIASVVLLVMALFGGVGVGVAMLTPKTGAAHQVETKTDEPEKPLSPSRSLKGEYRFLSMSFSRDGKALATVTMDAGSEPGDIRGKNAVRLWDVQSGSVKRTLAEHQIKDRAYSSYAGIGLSPDGKTVAAPAGGKLDGEDGFGWLGFVLWDAETGKIRHKLKHGLEVRALGFSPDGKTVASGSGCGGGEGDFESVKLWDIKTGHLLRTLKTRELEAVKVVFSPDSKLLAAVHDPVLDHSGWSAEVTLWDAVEGKTSQSLPDSAGIEAIAFSPDGKTLVGAARTKLRVWDVTTGKTIQASDLKTGFSKQMISAPALSPDGKTLALSGKQDDKHVIDLYDVKTAKRTKTLAGHAELLAPLAFSPDGNTLAGAGLETIYLWDFDRGTKLSK